jgi:serine/threonine protein kinase
LRAVQHSPPALADEAGGGGMKPRALLERLARPFSSRRSSSELRREKEEEADLEAIAAREQRGFKYEALAAATRGFSEKQRLGQGGFGPVYRGRLEDGRDVAVKCLGVGSRQGAREFRNEATLLSRVQHRNVVNLIGYCARGADEKLLVYEYVPNESLDKILFAPASGHRESPTPIPLR